MIRTAATVLALALAAAAPANAEGLSKIEQQVARELPNYGFDIDVRKLSSGQVAAIYAILHSGNSERGKRGLIQSTIGGPDTLRGLIFGRG